MKRFLTIVLAMLMVAQCGTIFAYAQDNQIVINEVCASNNKALLDSNGKAPDYVELYNNSSVTLSTDNLFISDSKSNLTKYKLPNIELDAGEYFVIFCGNEPTTHEDDEYYTGFSLSAKKETVYLSDGENIIDSIKAENAITDYAFSRVPDGSDNIEEIVATPNASNIKPDILEAPVFSYQSGFYDDEFDVEIIPQNENVEIYYTLDGSTPTKQSMHYTSPIHIDDASQHENVYSAIEDVSVFTRQDLIQKFPSISSNKLSFSLPEEKVDKCTVLRAICVDKDNNESKISTASYFVNFESKPEYANTEIISLVSNPINLFGYENGIFVCGKKLDESLTNKLGTTNYWEWDSNFYGDEKRKACFDYFSNAGEFVGNEDVSVSIKGSNSRLYPAKSMNLSVNSKYTGRDFLTLSYFTKKKESGISLSNGGQNVTTKEKDNIVSKIVANINVVTPQFRPCQLFVNGEYWGYYHISDRVFSKQYYESNFGLDTKKLAIIKRSYDYELNEGEQRDLIELNNLVEFAKTHDLSLQENYDEIASKVDLESLIDYYLAEFFFANTDWPFNNWAVWRCDDPNVERYGDNKWRFIIYDMNYGTFQETGYSSFFKELKNEPFFDNLLKNDDFKKRALARYQELVAGEFSYDRTSNIVKNTISENRAFIESGLKRYKNNDYDVTAIDNEEREMLLFLNGSATNSPKLLANHVELLEGTGVAGNCQHVKTHVEYRSISSSTCKTNGVTQCIEYCDECQEIVSQYNVNQALLPHTPKSVSGKASSYFSTGLTDATVCASCGKTLVPQREIPKKSVSWSKVKIGAGKVTLNWKKVSKSKGYQIQYSTSKAFSKKTTKELNIKSSTKTKSTVKGLKHKKTYYVRIRAYKKSGKKIIYSSWSKTKKITVK